MVEDTAPPVANPPPYLVIAGRDLPVNERFKILVVRIPSFAYSPLPNATPVADPTKDTRPLREPTPARFPTQPTASGTSIHPNSARQSHAKKSPLLHAGRDKAGRRYKPPRKAAAKQR